MKGLILSGKNSLQKEIGDIELVETAIKDYISQNNKHEFYFLYYDNENKFKIKPTKKTANGIRGFIQNFEKKIGLIDVLILIGGDRVVPFFRLENPCMDDDLKVLSDNPYVSRDEDYLIPEMICARIPDNRSADFIIRQFKKSFVLKNKAFGLSAKVWKEASKNVYKQIGNVRDLKLSPPVTTDNFQKKYLQDKDYLYFNLHGSLISPNWYGQDGNHYPIALNPENILNASGVVASEACYGAYIIGKSDKTAISLRFLSQDGVISFCGSTTIAYGPPAPPSTEADLLVKYFFEYVKQGVTTGEAFKNAKIDFARKMIRRYGFLDDDDQKTLLQFVLYGDPLIKY